MKQGLRIQDSGFREENAEDVIKGVKPIIRGYRDLAVWNRSVELVMSIYALTKNFPKDELYGLVSQIRRAAVSVPSNIAEGRTKRATKVFMRFLDVAYGSLTEVETQLTISEKLGYISGEDSAPVWDNAAHIGRMLNGLLASLEEKLPEY